MVGKNFCGYLIYDFLRIAKIRKIYRYYPQIIVTIRYWLRTGVVRTFVFRPLVIQVRCHQRHLNSAMRSAFVVLISSTVGLAFTLATCFGQPVRWQKSKCAQGLSEEQSVRQAIIYMDSGCVLPSLEPGPNPVVTISTRVGPGSRLRAAMCLLQPWRQFCPEIVASSHQLRGRHQSRDPCSKCDLQ